jgi:hypothetical protein
MSTAYGLILKKSLKIPKGNQNRYPHIEEERKHNGQKKKYKERSTKHTHKLEVNSGAPEGWAVPAPLMAPVVLI